jgi:hypothetical protein
MISPNANSDSSERSAGNGSPIGEAGHTSRYSLGRGLLVGLLIALVITVVLSVARYRRPPPRLSPAELDAARERWEKNPPSNYNLDVELSGNRAGKIHVEVRGGDVVRMTRDGVEPSQKRTWDVWSVPGQFDMIAQELEMAKDPARSFGTRGAAEVVIWAEFDPHYGYPRRYDRIVLGADIETHWHTQLEVFADKKQAN